jgi:hypothetical protein
MHYGVCIDLLTLTLTIKLSSRSALMLADPESPRGFILAFAGLHCPGSFTPRSYLRRMCQ